MDTSAVVADRLERWGKYLQERGATPIALIGLDAETQEVLLCTSEDLPDIQTTELIIQAAKITKRHRGR